MRVKDLRWEPNYEDSEWCLVKEIDRCYTIDKVSNVYRLETRVWLGEYGPDQMGLFGTMSDAKRAAQEDFNARINACVTDDV